MINSKQLLKRRSFVRVRRTVGRFVGGGDGESSAIFGEEIQVLVGDGGGAADLGIGVGDRGQTMTSPVLRNRRNIPPSDQRFPHTPITHLLYQRIITTITIITTMPPPCLS